jgi:hypothetical protein
MSTATKAKNGRATAPKRARRPRKGRTGPRGEPDARPRSESLGLDVDADVLEFIEALDRFKKVRGRPFPSWSEVLHVLRELGYHKG